VKFLGLMPLTVFLSDGADQYLTNEQWPAEGSPRNMSCSAYLSKQKNKQHLLQYSKTVFNYQHAHNKKLHISFMNVW
jgi:hypothetical protein